MTAEIERDFPRLAESGYRVTSPASRDYNCLAWAAGDNRSWWWPGSHGYWPVKAPREETMRAFLAAYRQIGFEPCADASYEPGIEKIAVYGDSSGRPTHTARQLPSGAWTSKLGKTEEIEHQTLKGLTGAWYGGVKRILRRPVPLLRRPSGIDGVRPDRGG